MIKQIVPRITATLAVAVTLGAVSVQAAQAATTSNQATINATTTTHSAIAVAPNFVGFCVTTWSSTNTWATTNCVFGAGLYNQYINCAGIARPVLGPVIVAPSIYLGSCPAGHFVTSAGADLL